ncbi:hypothetical protein KBY58_00565 [Cyanobium sp. HWJ4-Hawea]|uniref:hypothetical protein n=1 Tax=unclassified Cyanobium TaxID=2627006 RepID=UPI0020CFA55A|nr:MULTISPECIES: hypothetical protein [unclassified Cyanobium]MCP9774076.1 hypothetical protein [Cyanobium sp. WAJ14-Wanaka]MCP9807924.1 hypothetical protein [Cyanobium sp. HWJ4-Hawea]
MDHPFWILVPWAVFAVGIALKVWRIYWALRSRPSATAIDVEKFRQNLEMAWARGQKTA